MNDPQSHFANLKVVYLDQRQWIELARAYKKPNEHRALLDVGDALSRAVQERRICLPLTAANIYETYKINDPARRSDLGSLQSRMSRGLVFVGRYKRLAREIALVVRSICGLPQQPEEPYWYLSNLFFDAFIAQDDPRAPVPVSPALLTAIRDRSSEFLYDFWMSASDEQRQQAVRNWSVGSRELRQRLEGRRQAFQNESMSTRRRAYAAALLIDELDTINRFAQAAGAPWTKLTDMGAANLRRLVREVPAYHIERELAVRLEAQDRHIEENDLRDMDSFCAIVPYADCLIAEKPFVSLAEQSGLTRRYETRISSSFEDIAAFV